MQQFFLILRIRNSSIWMVLKWKDKTGTLIEIFENSQVWENVGNKLIGSPINLRLRKLFTIEKITVLGEISDEFRINWNKCLLLSNLTLVEFVKSKLKWKVFYIITFNVFAIALGIIGYICTYVEKCSKNFWG